MQIICENETEKQQLLEVSMYLHDFTVIFEKLSPETTVKIIKRWHRPKVRAKSEKIKEDCWYSLDLDKFPLLNFLAHLYTTPDLVRVQADSPTVLS